MKGAVFGLATMAAAMTWAADLPGPRCWRTLEAYAEAQAGPAIAHWAGEAIPSALIRDCTAWGAWQPTVLVLIGARIAHGGSADELISRFGAVSQTRGIKYWSVTQQAWEELIQDASALDSADPNQRRPDFSARELKEKEELYFVQDDNRSRAEVVYRMRVSVPSPDVFAVATENVGSIGFFMWTIFAPDDLRSVHILRRASDEEWRYVHLSAAKEKRRLLGAPPEASFVNRAIAAYRRFAGIPTDAEPPAMAGR